MENMVIHQVISIGKFTHRFFWGIPFLEKQIWVFEWKKSGASIQAKVWMEIRESGRRI